MAHQPVANLRTAHTQLHQQATATFVQQYFEQYRRNVILQLQRERADLCRDGDKRLAPQQRALTTARASISVTKLRRFQRVGDGQAKADDDDGGQEPQRSGGDNRNSHKDAGCLLATARVGHKACQTPNSHVWRHRESHTREFAMSNGFQWDSSVDADDAEIPLAEPMSNMCFIIFAVVATFAALVVIKLLLQ